MDNEIRDGSNVPLVKLLADAMLDKLNANNHKVHWNECSIDYLKTRLIQEVNELFEEIHKWDNNVGDPDCVLSEAADVANFAAMIAENILRWRWSPLQGKPKTELVIIKCPICSGSPKSVGCHVCSYSGKIVAEALIDERPSVPKQGS